MYRYRYNIHMTLNSNTVTTAVYPITRRVWMQTIAAVLCIIAAAGLVSYWLISETRVFTDKASINAMVVELAPHQSGVLQEIFVHEGDTVAAYMPVARVGNELVKSKTAGIVTSVPHTIGESIAPGEVVVDMIDPTELRVVGDIDEDKGLSRIAVGDAVEFTVDAFGGKTYTAVIDEVSPMSKQSGIVFNISDQREIQQFVVKARFDTTTYTELKNGMSARMWIYTK